METGSHWTATTTIIFEIENSSHLLFSENDLPEGRSSQYEQPIDIRPARTESKRKFCC